VERVAWARAHMPLLRELEAELKEVIEKKHPRETQYRRKKRSPRIPEGDDREGSREARLASMVGLGARPQVSRSGTHGRMMEYATGFRQARRKGRRIIETKHQDLSWEVVVQPDAYTELLGVITAYEVKRKRK